MKNKLAQAHESPSLGREIKTKLYGRGLNLRKAASLLEVPPATLRTWIDREKFPKSGLRKILLLLDSDESLEEIEKRYHLSEDSWAEERALPPSDSRESLREAFDKAETQSRKLDKECSEENVNLLDSCLRAMKDGDLLVLSTFSVHPMEFEPHRWETIGRAVAEGVRRGATFLYLFPFDDAIKELEQFPFWFNRLLSTQQIELSEAHFRQNVSAYLVKLSKEEVPSADTSDLVKKMNDLVNERIVVAKWTTNPFSAPGFTIGMIQTQEINGKRRRRMTIRVPTNFCGVLHLPEADDDVFCWRFIQVVIEALSKECASAIDTARRKSLLYIQSMLTS